MRTLAAKKGDEAMLAIFGKVQKELHISGRNRQDIQREEREEKAQQKRLADMDPLVRQLKQYREDAAHMRENNQMASVDTKLKSGEELTPEEQEYLKQNDPDAYREYQEIRKFLITDRPSGYGLEYFNMDTGSRKNVGKDTVGDF